MRGRTHTNGNTVDFTPRHTAVYDGRRQIGEVLIGRSIRAADAVGYELGIFNTQQEAIAAIVRAAKGEGDSHE